MLIKDCRLLVEDGENKSSTFADSAPHGQLKAITDEMARLKSELYSEHGGLGEIQKQLETLKTNPIMR